MKKTIVTAGLVCMVIGVYMAGRSIAEDQTPAVVESGPAVVSPVEVKPLVQLAILLDTSNSMDGLIDQARAELWSIVNEFITAKRNGRQTELRVALYEYGNDGLAANVGHIRQVVPFTTDLDKVSEELFALKTNGGNEYCGWVIQDAAEKLDWSAKADDLKVIFIAGNEPFTQGSVDYKTACRRAVEKGIIVNTIHCGGESAGISGMWKDGAVLADGKFLYIDQNKQVVHIPAPQDKEIAELSVKLNDTYIPFGANGNDFAARQQEQDKNASNLSPQSVVHRAVSKSSGLYQNSVWDLVDANKQENFKLAEVKAEELPENMRSMSIDERKGYIEAKAKERSEIQNRIQQLNQDRAKVTAEEMKKLQGTENTLGSAVIGAITGQAKDKNFTFNTPENSN